ncbi:MAG: NUDIX hydrolase [Acidimicrobiales bacterium]|jgi:8-oxo-dGTP pyrophosphatase MutT (NUDIX family)
MECIEAAGGVVVDMSKNKPRYLLIHRPRYNDWSLPKGKLNEGETHHDAALREVKEETGLVCDVLAKLSPVNYTTPNGNAKQVKYWLMQTRSGDFVKNDEVDDVSWVKRSKAISMLTHVHDQAVLVEAHVLVKELRRQAKNEAAE